MIRLHILHGHYLDFVKFVIRAGNKPVVWAYHEMWLATGQCGFAMDSEKMETGYHACEYLNYYPKVWVDNANSEYKV